MMIKREQYLNQLIESMNNGFIKVITGIRRCGKSFLLDPIFTDYLKNNNVKEDHIIKISLDERRNIKYYDPDVLDDYIRSLIVDDDNYYLILDEIQFVKEFESVLNGFLHIKNIDVYVTGSNSKFLSSDIITEFRGRSFQIHVMPLSFGEYYRSLNNDKTEAFNDYLLYGGLPQILSLKSESARASYLKDLFDYTYTKDMIERNNLRKSDIIDNLLNILASSVGSLTSATKLENSFKSNGYKNISKNTIISYLEYLENSFLINKVKRYDIKGKKYIESTSKYYYTDIGLRNARINFRQIEENHLMENIIYNELMYRGFNVDVGVVEIYDGKSRVQLECDFVCNQKDKRYYIQSALNVDTLEKLNQEQNSLIHIKDDFKKIIIVKDCPRPWYTNDGVLVIGLISFLLDKDLMNY